jgi:hypothetical protein
MPSSLMASVVEEPENANAIDMSPGLKSLWAK